MPPLQFARDPAARPERATLATLRTLLLGVLALGALGTGVELVLLEHVESWQQWVPLVLLALLLAGAALLHRSPSPGLVRAWRALMALLAAAGVAGIWLHTRGNAEFEVERDPAIGGARLLWESITGATPALAPGVLVQFALVGLVLAWRHPALERGDADAAGPARRSPSAAPSG